MPPHIFVILNAAAGGGDATKDIAGLTEQFRGAGLDAKVSSVRTREEFIAATERAMHEAPHAVVAGGGDGTVSAVASRLVGTQTALGVLPLGTLNHFARDLHIPAGIAEAAQIIIAGNVGTVDVGEVNGQFFLNNSSLGIYPEIVRHREFQQHQGAAKWPAFLRATLGVLRRHPFLSVRLIMNGDGRQRRTPFVLIGNNEYCMEGLHAGERASLQGGKLGLYLTRHRGTRWGLLRLAVMTLLGTLRQAREFEAFTVADVVIETRHGKVRVALDGEVTMMDTPLKYVSRPRALRVFVPAPQAAD